MKIFGITGWKNSGKTGLVTRLVETYKSRGLTVATLKHAHHSFSIDHAGTDSFRHKEAGADEVMILSGGRWVLMHEARPSAEQQPDLQAALARLSPCDIVLIEGFKSGAHPKLFCHRAENGALTLPQVPPVAIASDVTLGAQSLPVFDLNDTNTIADWIWEHADEH